MEKLRFSDSVFEVGAGRIYEILIKISAPALFAGILVIAVINTGMMTQVSTYPEWMKVILQKKKIDEKPDLKTITIKIEAE